MPAVARIVFMGTPEFAVASLQTLVNTQTVVGVVTQPDKPAGRGSALRPSPVKVFAESAGIPVYQPKSLRSEEAAAPLRHWAPDVIIVAAFGQILRPHVLYLAPHGSINVHASLLPRWRGASPIQHALLAGDDRTGISLMRMDEGLDTGPVYVQESIDIALRETAATLHDRLAQLGATMLALHLDAILDGRLEPVAQNDQQATYAPMIRKEAGAIDWQQDAATLDRLVRAMTPWPGAYTTWRGQMLKVLAARPASLPPDAGRTGLVCLTAEGVVIVTGGGGLLLKTVQLAGKRPLSAEDFVRGRPDLIGSVLGEDVPAPTAV